MKLFYLKLVILLLSELMCDARVSMHAFMSYPSDERLGTQIETNLLKKWLSAPNTLSEMEAFVLMHSLMDEIKINIESLLHEQYKFDYWLLRQGHLLFIKRHH